MLEKLMKEISKKYNLEFKIQQKLPKVFMINFMIEKNELSFVYMIDSMMSFEENLKKLEYKLNGTIIDYYKKRGI